MDKEDKQAEAKEFKHHLLSEFNLSEITNQKFKNLVYNNQETLLSTIRPQIKLIRQRTTGQISKILIANNSNIRIFEVNPKTSTLTYAFSTQLLLPRIKGSKKHILHNLTPHSSECENLIWLANQKKADNWYQQLKHPSILCRASLKNLKK